MIRSRPGVAQLLGALALGILTATVVGAKPWPRAEPLFSDGASDPAESSSPADPSVLRTRLARVQLDGLDDASAVTLNLFPDVATVANRVDLVRHGPGRFTWFGSPVGEPRGHVALAVRDGKLVGNVRSELGSFHVRPANGMHRISEIDRLALPPNAEPLSVEPAEPAPTALPGSDSGEFIDVLIVYTPAAASGMGDVEAFLQLAVDETNQSYTNSEIHQRVNLVDHAQVGYVESGSTLTDLLRLHDPFDGFMDEVHSWRNASCADVVSLFHENTDFCGLAFQMTVNNTGFAPNAFSAVRRSCATGDYSFGHEMGHNMGCHHDHLATNNPGVHPFSHGYVNVAGGWRTIMAVVLGTRLQYWSNPDVFYEGEPMGVPANQTDPADCHRTLNITASTVAQFRDSTLCVLRVPEGSLQVDRPGAEEVTLSWGPACGVVADYTIYEGELDTLTASATYSHESRVCTDAAGDLAETFQPGEGNTYYLVVPRDVSGKEGSYGADRPQGPDRAACNITDQRPGGVCP